MLIAVWIARYTFITRCPQSFFLKECVWFEKKLCLNSGVHIICVSILQSNPKKSQCDAFVAKIKKKEKSISAFHFWQLTDTW